MLEEGHPVSARAHLLLNTPLGSMEVEHWHAVRQREQVPELLSNVVSHVGHRVRGPLLFQIDAATLLNVVELFGRMRFWHRQVYLIGPSGGQRLGYLFLVFAVATSDRRRRRTTDHYRMGLLPFPKSCTPPGSHR